MIHVRKASTLDARDMAILLNEIIRQGGTTALKDPLTTEDMQMRLSTNTTASAWQLAEDESGLLLGFQSIGAKPSLGANGCDIATFARVERTQLGIGSALFESTRKAATALGYTWINATIMLQNHGGQAYYQSRGFEPWKQDDTRIFMRFNL